MQTLANISGNDAVHRQISINMDSLSRFMVYYRKYKAVLLLQMKVTERVKQQRRKSTTVIPIVTEQPAPSARPGLFKAASLLSIGKPTGTSLIYPAATNSSVGSKSNRSTSTSTSAPSGPGGGGNDELLVSHMDK